MATLSPTATSASVAAVFWWSATAQRALALVMFTEMLVPLRSGQP
jgi:hypothetical protein